MISVLVVAFCIIGSIKIIKATADSYDSEFIIMLCCVVTVIFSILFIIVGINACENLIEVNTVPEKYIIEMVQDATD